MPELPRLNSTGPAKPNKTSGCPANLIWLNRPNPCKTSWTYHICRNRTGLTEAWPPQQNCPDITKRSSAFLTRLSASGITKLTWPRQSRLSAPCR